MEIPVHPDDELRTVTWIMRLDDKWHCMSLRYHIPHDIGENVMDAMLRTAIPQVTANGKDVAAVGHFAVFRRYLTNEELENQYEAIRESLEMPNSE